MERNKKEMLESYERKLAKYNKDMKEYNEVIAMHKPVEDLSNKNLEKLIRPFKVKSDGKMPKAKPALIALYKNILHRGLKQAPLKPTDAQLTATSIETQIDEEEFDGEITKTAEM